MMCIHPRCGQPTWCYAYCVWCTRYDPTYRVWLDSHRTTKIENRPPPPPKGAFHG